MGSVVLVARRYATYDDVPGKRYHFPRLRYEAAIRGAEGELVLVYEPRRGGDSVSSNSGGRQAFVAWAVLGPVEADPERSDHAYVRFTAFQELPVPVPLSSVPISGKALQWAVLPVDPAFIEAVLQRGLAPMLTASVDTRGYVDRAIPDVLRGRPLREVVREELVRDRGFRFKVVEQAYDGCCSMTGLRLTNGNGRAEVDAAHIVPVAAGGPDLVSNGLALTKTVHWAFDRGLVSVSYDGKILIAERGIPEDLRRLLRPDRSLLLPTSAAYAPHPGFLEWHRRNVFKGNASEWDDHDRARAEPTGSALAFHRMSSRPIT